MYNKRQQAMLAEWAEIPAEYFERLYKHDLFKDAKLAKGWKTILWRKGIIKQKPR